MRCKKPRLLFDTTGIEVQGPLEVDQNERMTFLASSHRYIADVGGICCWLSGSDAKHGVGQVRRWHAREEGEGTATSPLDAIAGDAAMYELLVLAR